MIEFRRRKDHPLYVKDYYPTRHADKLDSGQLSSPLANII